jgi:hypothetical protein
VRFISDAERTRLKAERDRVLAEGIDSYAARMQAWFKAKKAERPAERSATNQGGGVA